MGFDTSGLQLPSAGALAQDDAAVYGVLGVALLSFLLTFGVAPRFKSHFKEPDTWRDIFADLVAGGGVPTISPLEAASQADRGAVLMDVRLERKFTQGAMPRSVNFPLYQPISGWSLPANIRRAGFAFFGIYGTERNTRWLSQVEEAVPKGSEVIVACDMGGSLETKPGADTGFQSQSLKAAHYLKQAGYSNVKHMQGGVDEYKRSMGPVGEAADAGLPALQQR